MNPNRSRVTIELDLGDRRHTVCVLDGAGQIMLEETIANIRECLEQLSQRYPRASDASTFSQNQSRLIQHEVADLFSHEVVELARAQQWVSNEHFTVDGTLIEAWASMKSFKPKSDRSGPGPVNPWSGFIGQPRKKDTHASTTDSDAKLVRKTMVTKLARASARIR
jgi:hypothetical protein